MIITLPKISIVTPSYNQGEYLEECIDSVLSQNYPNLEYIVMDGGSSDNSVEIIKKYEKYLSYWQSKKDDGQYAAIEDGFRRSTGEILAWLNSDDKYHHNAFYKVAYIFSTFQHMEWIVGRPTFWDKNGNVSLVYSSLPTYGRGRFLLKDYNNPFIQQESSFWRRTLWEKAGGYLRRDLGYAGDLELWLRFFRFAELQTVDAILGGFRSHGNQKAALCMDKYMAEAEIILDEEITLFKGSIGIQCSELPCPPNPLPVLSGEVARYMAAAFTGYEMKLFKLTDESDKVTDCLLRQTDCLLRQREAADAEVEAMRRSLSWRITKPLRWLRGTIK